MSNSKTPLGFALVVLLLPVGFVLGATLGALRVPDGSGLAGGAIVFGYGVVGTVLAIIGGAALAVRLARRQLIRAVWTALAFAAIAALGLFLRYRAMGPGAESHPVEEPARRPTSAPSDPGHV